MQAYKCDICKEFFTEQSDLVICDKSYCFLKASEGRKIDICPNCAEAIQKAIDKRSVVTIDKTKS